MPSPRSFPAALPGPPALPAAAPDTAPITRARGPLYEPSCCSLTPGPRHLDCVATPTLLLSRQLAWHEDMADQKILKFLNFYVFQAMWLCASVATGLPNNPLETFRRHSLEVRQPTAFRGPAPAWEHRAVGRPLVVLLVQAASALPLPVGDHSPSGDDRSMGREDEPLPVLPPEPPPELLLAPAAAAAVAEATRPSCARGGCVPARAELVRPLMANKRVAATRCPRGAVQSRCPPATNRRRSD